MSAILNLTQHRSSPSQVEAGVVEPADKAGIKALLTFSECPLQEDLDRAATSLALKAKEGGFSAAMIGGFPALMHPLHNKLEELGIRPYYAFSLRKSSEVTLFDGSIKKISVFIHAGWANEEIEF